MSSSPVLNAAEKLSVSERVAYGLGDMASNLSFGAVSLFLLFFYTNVFGLSTIEASAIFLIARVIDAIYNLLLGYVVDKTHTRHGKLRPYLLYGAVPLGMLTMLCFSTPETQHKFVYALITYTLYCLAVKTRQVIDAFPEQFRTLLAPFLECLNWRLVAESSLWNAVVVDL